jgi:NADPH:quinone reductase-like Zn-dependent oxidoreductase
MDSFGLLAAGAAAAGLAFLFLLARKRQQIPKDKRVGDHYHGWALVTGASSGIGEKVLHRV